MSLFTRDGFDAALGRLPGVSFVDQWGGRVAKVGEKVFCLLWDSDARIVFKCSEDSFDILTDLEDVTQAPYFAKRKWVAVGREAPLEPAELHAYVERSHALVAAGLTKKLRVELGIG